VKTADATAMPFPDDSFDSVVSCLMLHHIIDWEGAVAEVARVLRPGGIFVGYDLTRSPLASLFHRLDGSPHRLIVPDDFRTECARHGLTASLQSRVLGLATPVREFYRWSTGARRSTNSPTLWTTRSPRSNTPVTAPAIWVPIPPASPSEVTAPVGISPP
jgi:SAM-dependent methyltransferase